MGNKYYKDLFEIMDLYRKMKYEKLLLASMQDDIRKWTETVKDDKVIYHSPIYGGSQFCIEVRSYFSFSYITHATPIIAGQNSELINDNDTQTKEFKTAYQNLRQSIFTPEIYEIEKSIGNQHNRKDKLEQLNIEAYKNIIEDSYNDFIKEPSEAFARMIARTAYGFNKNHNLPYSEWLEKFKEYPIVEEEIKRLDNYKE